MSACPGPTRAPGASRKPPKLEIGEANELRLPLGPRATEHGVATEDVLHADGRRAARALADRLILQDGIGLSVSEVDRLNAATDTLRTRRGHW